MKRETQLSKRLKLIAKLVSEAQQAFHYHHIWDCCCDHGYLGIYLLEHFSKINTFRVQINFIDQVPHITKQLGKKLQQEAFSKFKVQTINAEDLELDEGKRHCLIIAGVTTTGTIKILQALLKKYSKQNLDFVLCPTRGQFDLRQYLIKQKIHLMSEEHIEENGRHYEILQIRHYADKQQKTYTPISSIGEFWQQDNTQHSHYLKSRIQHFRQAALNSNQADLQTALQLYSDMYQKLKTDQA